MQITKQQPEKISSVKQRKSTGILKRRVRFGWQKRHRISFATQILERVSFWIPIELNFDFSHEYCDFLPVPIMTDLLPFALRFTVPPVFLLPFGKVGQVFLDECKVGKDHQLGKLHPRRSFQRLLQGCVKELRNITREGVRTLKPVTIAVVVA